MICISNNHYNIKTVNGNTKIILAYFLITFTEMEFLFYVSSYFWDEVNNSLVDRPKLWAICLVGVVLCRLVTSFYAHPWVLYRYDVSLDILEYLDTCILQHICLTILKPIKYILCWNTTTTSSLPMSYVSMSTRVHCGIQCSLEHLNNQWPVENRLDNQTESKFRVFTNSTSSWPYPKSMKC